jgi:hypothetical protein
MNQRQTQESNRFQFSTREGRKNFFTNTNKDKYGRKKMWYSFCLTCWRPWGNSIEQQYYKMCRDIAKNIGINMGNEVG